MIYGGKGANSYLGVKSFNSPFPEVSVPTEYVVLFHDWALPMCLVLYQKYSECCELSPLSKADSAANVLFKFSMSAYKII